MINSMNILTISVNIIVLCSSRNSQFYENYQLLSKQILVSRNGYQHQVLAFIEHQC